MSVAYGSGRGRPGVVPFWARLRALLAPEAGYFTMEFFLCAGALLSLMLNQYLFSIAVLMFLACSAVLIVRDPLIVPRTALAWAAFLPVPLFAIMSTYWSDTPTHTLRLALQLTVTIGMALVVANRISPRQLVGAFFLGLFVVGLMSITIGRTAGHAGYEVLIGVFGSKNQMAFMAQTLFACAMGVLFDRGQPKVLRVAGLAIAPVAIYMVFAGHSAGALVSLGFGIIAFASLLVLSRCAPHIRVIIILAVILSAIVAAMELETLQAAAETFMIEVLGKDTTLTGRTYIWDRAAFLIRERPILGYGYSSFWVQGNLEAEGLWRMFAIHDRSGFNFHNAYFEVMVDMGWVGLVALVFTLAAIGLGLVLTCLLAPSAPGAFFATTYAVLMLRTTTESAVLYPWSIYTAIYFASGVYGWKSAMAAIRQARAARYARPPRPVGMRPVAR